MSRAETFPKPSILCHFLPTDAPLKATQPVDFGAALKPAVREGREGDVAELLAALTQARQMVTWALDKDRSMVGVDELASSAFDAAPRPPAPAPKQAEGSSWFSRKKQAPAAPDAAARRGRRRRASQDLRLGLAEAWAALALAEAQHATIRRAAAAPIEWSLVAALCADERQRYADAIARRRRVPHRGGVGATSTTRAPTSRRSRATAPAAALEKAVADTDEASCGVACAELAEAARAMAAASASAKDYVANAKAVCYVDSPVVALGDAAATIRRALDRANQLNNGIFHKPVPPPGPLPPAKSLVTAIPFDDPPPSPLWTDRAWAAFGGLPRRPSARVRGRDCA
ncbi:3'-tRNA processing endoribonuclease [Aureococcus anophagefferens]|nr:3'-tRNA processing endoribonuclease [Aureococcus anophagefferens]